MSRKDTHTVIGVLAGGVTAAYRAKEQESAQLLEFIGGCIGGYFGGRLPDIIEPASWPGHRQFAHSAVAGGGVAYGLHKLLDDWEKYFRSRAEYYKSKSSEEYLHWLQKLYYAIIGILFRIAAGGLSGLGVGYLSHLLLDGGTPNGLPIIR